jgi:hypothetical protein
VSVLSFFHGKQLCQIAPVSEGKGFVGLRNGRIVATAGDRASIARALIKAARWRRDGQGEA